jgi:glycosyltransferase involved in cell wall biosynthesis
MPAGNENGRGTDMILGQKVVVVMPAYNAEKTLCRTYKEIPHEIVDEVVLVDDASQDHTVDVSEELGIRTVIHPENRGYGGNQKTCYRTALGLGADIVIMLHPDYQYTPLLITAMASLLAEGLFDCVLGSRILGIGARVGGMPLYKYLSNRFLTAVQNLIVGYKLSEYHTGYRGFTRELLESLPYEENSDDFVFDNEVLCQIICGGYDIGEITCPTLYDDDSSSIGFSDSVAYGWGVLKTSALLFLHRRGVVDCPLFAHVTPRTGSRESRM